MYQTIFFSLENVKKSRHFYLQNGLWLDGSSAVLTGPWPYGCWRHIDGCVDGLSLSIWMKFNAYPTECRDYGIISSLNENLGNGFFLLTWNCGSSLMGFGIREPDTGTSKHVQTSMPSLGVWCHHVYTMAYNLGTTPSIKLYIDGSFETDTVIECCQSDATASNTIRDVLIFGNRYADNYQTYYYYSHMIIDDVAIFEHILSPAEAAMIYNL